MKQIRSIYLLVALAMGACSSVPTYQGPIDRKASAAISTFGSAFSTCGLTATIVKPSICDARVQLVDGRPTSMWATRVELDPGEHSLLLMCAVAFGAGPTDKNFFFTEFVSIFNADEKFRIEAIWNGTCHMRLVNEKTGEVVHGNLKSDANLNQQSAGTQVLESGQRLGDDFLEILVPKSKGWMRLNKTKEVISLVRQGKQRNETYAAQIIRFPIISTTNIDEFASIVRTEVEKDSPPDRFSIVSSKFNQVEKRRYSCLRHDGVYIDKKAKTGQSSEETLTLQVAALYCQHPYQKNTGFAAIYSHRGEIVQPTIQFEIEAEDFIEGVQVPKK